MSNFDISALDQVEYRVNIDSFVIYINPYLSNSVQEKEDPDIVRLVKT